MTESIQLYDFYEYIKRFKLDDALIKIGALSQRIINNDPALKEYAPNYLNEFVLAFLAKALILSANDYKQEVLTRETLFITLNKFYDLYDKILDVQDSQNESEKISTFESYFLRTANQQFPFQTGLRHLFPRSYILFNDIPKLLTTEKIDLHSEVNNLYSLTVDEFILVGFSIFAGLKDSEVNIPFITGSKIPSLNRYVGNGKLEKLVDLLTINYKQYRDRNEKEETNKELSVYSFNPLRAFPIIKTTTSKLVVPVPRFLVERITTGIYYDLMDKFRTPTDNQFLAFFGKEIFEHYVGMLLEEHYSKVDIVKEFPYGSRHNRSLSPDWIIFENNSAILIQCKTSGLSKNARLYGDLDLIQKDLRKRVIEGINQSNKFLIDYEKNKSICERLKKVNKIHCVILTYERIYMAESPIIRKRIDEELKKRNISLTYNILSIDQLETLIPNLCFVKFSDLLEIKKTNEKWKLHAEFDSYLFDYLRSNEIKKFNENSLLKSKFQQIFSQISSSFKLK